MISYCQTQKSSKKKGGEKKHFLLTRLIDCYTFGKTYYAYLNYIGKLVLLLLYINVN